MIRPGTVKHGSDNAIRFGEHNAAVLAKKAIPRQAYLEPLRNSQGWPLEALSHDVIIQMKTGLRRWPTDKQRFPKLLRAVAIRTSRTINALENEV